MLTAFIQMVHLRNFRVGRETEIDPTNCYQNAHEIVYDKHPNESLGDHIISLEAFLLAAQKE